MHYRGLLFDLDGVIVDTAKYHFMAWKEIATKIGINFTEKDNERLKGVSRKNSLEIILEIGNISLSEKEIDYYCEEKNNIYLTYINRLSENDILPNVKQFLQEAKCEGYKIGLGSSSKNAIMILKKLNIENLFDIIIDGNSVDKAKPDPEVFTKGAHELDLENKECIVFEDSEAGIEAAHICGMKAVGIGKKELLPQADVNFESFNGITIDTVIVNLKQEYNKCLN